MKLLRELGPVVAAYQDRILVDLLSTRIECDEIWAFCYSKDRNVPEAHEGEWGFGDVWDVGCARSRLQARRVVAGGAA